MYGKDPAVNAILHIALPLYVGVTGTMAYRFHREANAECPGSREEDFYRILSGAFGMTCAIAALRAIRILVVP